MKNRESPTTEQIEQRAYALFLERGGQDGYALEDWLSAEKELTERSDIAEPQRSRAASAGKRS